MIHRILVGQLVQLIRGRALAYVRAQFVHQLRVETACSFQLFDLFRIGISRDFFSKARQGELRGRLEVQAEIIALVHNRLKRTNTPCSVFYAIVSEKIGDKSQIGRKPCL